MKKLQLQTFAVQEMNVFEMQENQGGCGWCRFRDRILVPPLEFIAVKVLKRVVEKVLPKLG